MATKTKKPTTTKKPAAKKTAVIKAHRGMAHVPRGRRRPPRDFGGDPRRRPQVEPRRRGDDRPRAPGIDRPQMPRGRNPRIMTPAMRRRLMEMRRRAQQRATPFTSSLGRQTPAQLKAARDRFNKIMEANRSMKANVFGRGRKPTQATQTPRRRPTGTPRPRGRIT